MLILLPVQPAIAILHTLYGIYKLSRSPIGRPPTLQANYMLFASTFDIGLIAFYVFTAYISYAEYTNGAYHWSTLLGDDLIPHQIATAAFFLGVINGALHLVSFGISLFLMTAFRRIARLPPDMNPLEDNLTARPHKRTKSEVTEKHSSQSTLDSGIGMDDPLIGSPRNMPFPMHSHGDFYGDGSNQFVLFPGYEYEQPRGPFFNPDQLPYVPDQLPIADVPRIPEMQFQQKAEQKRNSIPRKPVQNFQMPGQNINGSSTKLSPPTHLEVYNHGPSTVNVPNRIESVSPMSDNWVAYPSRSPSPLDNVLKGNTYNEDGTRRDTSSKYSRSNTTASTSSVAKDWLGSSQRYRWDVGEIIAEDVRGEYESIATREYYANDDEEHGYPQQNGLHDGAEQDLGDHPIDIYTDHQQSDDDEDVDNEQSALHLLNPLGLNPPTPQPSHDGLHNTAGSANGRIALADIPNLSPDMRSSSPLGDSPMKKTGRACSGFERKASSTTRRNVSGQGQRKGSKKNQTAKQSKSQKKSSYGALRQDDHGSDNDDGNESDGVPSADIGGNVNDRKGRVVSNSGADVVTPGRNNGGSTAAGLASYGSYIAGLGVGMGRRRDVSGKMAEEGRSGTMVNAGRPGTEPEHKTPIRAAGWARFAGL